MMRRLGLKREEDLQEQQKKGSRNHEQNQYQSPPPNRVPASPYFDDDCHHSENDSSFNFDGSHTEFPQSSSNKSLDNFGDAEDYINTMAGGIQSKGYYQSFVMESPPSIRTMPRDGVGNLHHRHNHHNNAHMTPGQETGPHFKHNFYDDESPMHRLMRQRQFLSPHKHHAIQQLNDNPYHHQKFSQSLLSSLGSARVVRWCFLVALSLYLVILFRSTSDLGSHSRMNYDFIMGNMYDINCFSGSGYTRGIGCQQPTPYWYKEQMKQAEDALLKRETRKIKRRGRTKLPLLSRVKKSKVSVDWHNVESLDENQNHKANDFKEVNSDDLDTASVDMLCGYSAQNSSLVSPESYPASAALNENSRVMITGILNPIGLALALRLKQECGVQHVWGVDAMYPNTVLNRLMVHERMLLLNSNSDDSDSTRQVVLPYLGLDPKSKKLTSKSGEEPRKLSLKDEMLWMRGFEPTHVVHLASYSMDAYSDTLIDPKWKNTHSPYIPNDYATSSIKGEIEEEIEPYMFPLRSGMVAMEQILQTMAEFSEEDRPQFLYTANSKNFPGSYGKVFHAMKQMDELLVDTYHTRHNEKLPSIGLRLPNSIYGPWGQPGSVMHDMLERIVEENGGKTKNSTAGIKKKIDGSENLDLLYVDDAVDIIISALQHRSDKPMKLDVPPERTSSIESLSSAASFLLRDDSTGHQLWADDQSPQIEKTKEASLILPKTQKTTLKDGLVKTIAWHKDRLSPFGPAARSDEDEESPAEKTRFETGDDFLQRHKMKTCGPYDTDCHKNNDYLPCNSECNIHDQCLPSVFDGVQDLLYDISEGCDVVMYTQMMGFNVEDAELHAEYMDDSNLDDNELLVCNFAIVPRESDLVTLVSSKVPMEQLDKFGIEHDNGSTNMKAFKEKKLDGLNGRLLYRGWVLVWVKDGMRELSVPDASLLKLSPSKFFHPNVKYGLFVEDNFKVSPNLDDVLFLVDQMHRNKLNDRTLKKETEIETPNGPIIQKVKYHIPAEPARRAAMLFAPLRYPNIDDPIVEQYRGGRRQLTVNHAAKFMSYEVGYQPGDRESASHRRQREFYERIPGVVNRNTELRSNSEPWYRYSMRHWVRSRWVLHDFTLEDSRLLRCDWYQEHVQWGNDLDQLSFAKVMAVRDLKRRLAHQEPDDRIKSFIEKHPELHGLTDSYEWHSMETEVNKLYREPTNWDSKPPPSTQVAANANEELEENSLDANDTPLYVRIMSERVMATSRKVWAKMRKKLAKAKKERQAE